MQPIAVIEEIWTGSRSEERESQATAAADITAAVDRLDGKSRNLVIFDRGDRSLTIGGGAGGQYVGYVAVGIDEAFYSLVDPGKSADETVRLVVGGQLSAYPARQVVDRQTVVDAALYFAERGDRSPALNWEDQT